MKKRLKGLLALILSLVMVLGMVVTASAETATSVTIGGVTLNSTKPYLVNGAAADAGTLGSDGCTAYFEASTGTLSLNSASVSYSTVDDFGTVGICATGDLTIRLVNFQGADMNGTSSVAASGSGGTAVYIKGNLTIGGVGTLKAEGDYDGIRANSISISDSMVNVIATGTNSDGIHANGGNIEISGGTVEAKGHNGIEVSTSGKITISGGTVTATGIGNTSAGITAVGNVEITGGTVSASGVDNGILATGTNSVTITGGTVSAKAGESGAGIAAGTINIGGDDNPTVNVGCQIGLAAGTVNINKGSTVEINANTRAVGEGNTLNLNDGSSVWYQWTTTQGGTPSKSKLNYSGDKYLKIEPHTYTVEFNANGGTGTMEKMTFAYDVSQNLSANTFTRDGYTFDGWNTAANGTGNPYIDNAKVGNLTTVPNDTVTLYAQWSLKDTSGQGTSTTYIPTYTPTVVETPNTFDSGIALSVAVTILSVTGSAWLAKKKED